MEPYPQPLRGVVCARPGVRGLLRARGAPGQRRHRTCEPWPDIPQRLDVRVPHQTAVSDAVLGTPPFGGGMRESRGMHRLP